MPSFDLLGVYMGPLVAIIVKHTVEEQPHFFCVEMARNSANGHPTKGLPPKGRSDKRVLGEEEWQLDELDCPGSPEWVIPPALVQQQWLGHFCPVAQWSPNTSLM